MTIRESVPFLPTDIDDLCISANGDLYHFDPSSPFEMAAYGDFEVSGFELGIDLHQFRIRLATGFKKAVIPT